VTATRSGEFPNRHTAAQILASESERIKRAATKRGGSATIAPETTSSRVTEAAAPKKIMGAGVAAGPHCPSTGTWPGRQGVPHRAVSSDGARTGGSRRRFLRGPFPAEAGAGFPAGSPTRAEALAVRRSAVRNSRPSSPHRGSSAEASVPMMAGSSAEASVPPGVHGPKSWVRRFRSSRAETRSCPTNPEPKPHPRRWRRLDRSPAFRRAGPEPEGPVSRLKASRLPEGRLETLWALHEACRFRFRSRTSPQLPPRGGFVSRPALASVRPAARRRPARFRLGLWLGRLSPVAGRSSRPRVNAVMKSESVQALSACG
jgi:hypothetical protein